MKHFRISVLFTLATLMALSPARAVELATYRALYLFEPARIDQATPSKPVDGQLAYEVAGSECAGYTIDSRFANRFSDGEQGNRVIDLQSSTYESTDGQQLEVTQKQFVNKEPADDKRISISRLTAAEEGKGDIKGSSTKTFRVARDVLFPTAHQKKLLALAQAGATHDVSNLYDGSDDEKQYRVVTFIGKRRPAGADDIDLKNPITKELENQASWPFQLGYYPLDDKQAEVPEFQANFNMYENGISTHMLFDYGSYSMQGNIMRLELTKPDACDASLPKHQSTLDPTPQ